MYPEEKEVGLLNNKPISTTVNTSGANWMYQEEKFCCYIYIHMYIYRCVCTYKAIKEIMIEYSFKA